MDEQTWNVIESLLAKEPTLMLVSIPVFLLQSSNMIEGFLSFVSLQTEHQKMIPSLPRIDPIVRAKPSADTYHDIIPCGTKEAYVLRSFLLIFGDFLVSLDGSPME